MIVLVTGPVIFHGVIHFSVARRTGPSPIFSRSFSTLYFDSFCCPALFLFQFLVHFCVATRTGIPPILFPEILDRAF